MREKYSTCSSQRHNAPNSLLHDDTKAGLDPLPSMFILQKNKSSHLTTSNSLYIERFANSKSKAYWIAA